MLVEASVGDWADQVRLKGCNGTLPTWPLPTGPSMTARFRARKYISCRASAHRVFRSCPRLQIVPGRQLRNAGAAASCYATYRNIFDGVPDQASGQSAVHRLPTHSHM